MILRLRWAAAGFVLGIVAVGWYRTDRANETIVADYEQWDDDGLTRRADGSVDWPASGYCGPRCVVPMGWHTRDRDCLYRERP